MTTELISQRMTDSIRELILSGEFAPGSKISQEALASRFGASRIPVREALNRLESDGLVVLKPNCGAWVAKLDLQECLEIYKIRERVEPLALSEAVANITDAEIDALEALVLAMERASEPEEFLRLDREFHLASYRAARMNMLAGMVERFWNTTQHYRRAFTSLLGSEGSWIIHAEHKLIIDALRRRDADGAGHLLHEHIRRTRFELERHQELFSNQATAAQ
ncbi:GntR family transcriptional regulator [Pseudoduganella sp. OTU4001]|uniref:GntR family transcriptional regulator n=1 Tax=Pseudoduganella sp. OTU4001 TaxID=3043854 RepID=UPI00313A9E81